MAIHNSLTPVGLGSISASQISAGTVTGASTIAYHNVSPQSNITLDPNGKIKANALELGGVDVGLALTKIQERLSILVPDPKRLEKYEALRQAYEHYKTLEALCLEEENGKNQ